MRLEVGKLYKTAGGEIVECIAVWSKSVDGFQATCCPIKFGDPTNYSIDGFRGGGECAEDVVAEYTSPPKTKTVKMAPALFLDDCRYHVSGMLYANELHARQMLGRGFVRWLIDSHGIDVEVPDAL